MGGGLFPESGQKGGLGSLRCQPALGQVAITGDTQTTGGSGTRSEGSSLSTGSESSLGVERWRGRPYPGSGTVGRAGDRQAGQAAQVWGSWGS